MQRNSKLFAVAILIAACSPPIAVHAQNNNMSVIQPSTSPTVRRLPGASRFQLISKGGGPVAVTFDKCNNTAKDTCTNGVEHVDHDEETGSCSFSCFAAPKK